ncbi:MAG: Asp-tRNA(Asn)/Glu-tRNA(Gln) amidotransferase subunit GatB [Saccharofermentanales bacterium]
MMKQYETVIGLEIHVELSTKSKIFCTCTTAFGGEPNTHCCPVCTGMPGTLPVLNKKVVESAILAGLATNCQISPNPKFDRKNYFYPDLPKAYQISQLYLPICKNGFVDIDLPSGETKTIRIHEIHMEEDAGKLMHDPWDDCTLVDYNRCGVPLLEIVGEPDLRNAGEAISYLNKIKAILQYLGVSDCKMQEGSFRADINLSVRPIGQEQFGTRTEMKNMNSMKAIAKAIEKESKRQIEAIEDGKKIRQETRRWDENKDASFAMRSKENAQDYRYFPDPDLLPCEISDEWIKSLNDRLPELPDQKKQRYINEYALPLLDVEILTATKKIADLFENTIASGSNPKEVSNWIMSDLMKLLKENQIEADDLKIDPAAFAEMLKLLQDGKINRNAAKGILSKLLFETFDLDEYIKTNNLEMIDDDEGLRECVKAVLLSNEQSLIDYKSGKEKAFLYLVGQVMKQMKGKANPAAVHAILKEEIEK